MILWLVRHARCAVPEGLCYGRSDVPLADPGWDEALVARVRADAPAIYTSPLRRCRSLAERIGPATSDARLVEVDFGRWEMQPWSAIDRGELDAWRAALEHWKGHGGESLGEVAARAASFLADLGASGAPAACVVTHAGVIRVIRCLVSREPLARALDYSVPFGGAMRIEWPAG